MLSSTRKPFVPTALISTACTDIELTLEGPLPEGIRTGCDAVENITWTPEVTVRGNLSEYVPTRGILFHSLSRKPVPCHSDIGMDCLLRIRRYRLGIGVNLGSLPVLEQVIPYCHITDKPRFEPSPGVILENQTGIYQDGWAAPVS